MTFTVYFSFVVHAKKQRGACLITSCNLGLQREYQQNKGTRPVPSPTATTKNKSSYKKYIYRIIRWWSGEPENAK